MIIIGVSRPYSNVDVSFESVRTTAEIPKPVFCLS